MTRAEDRDRLLRIYLDDHLAGSAAGVRRARRLAEAERDGPDGDALAELVADIEQDRRALLAIVDGLGFEQRRAKQVLAAVVERLGSMKLNGRLFRRSPSTSVVETEMMMLALRGKLAGWHVLAAAVGPAAVRAATGGRVDLDELEARGRRQFETMTAIHERTARRVFGAAAPAA